MIREILALGLSKDKERIGVKTALCFGLKIYICCIKTYPQPENTPISPRQMINMSSFHLPKSPAH